MPERAEQIRAQGLRIVSPMQVILLAGVGRGGA